MFIQRGSARVFPGYSILPAFTGDLPQWKSFRHLSADGRSAPQAVAALAQELVLPPLGRVLLMEAEVGDAIGNDRGFLS